jgi:cell division protein FtsQ
MNPTNRRVKGFCAADPPEPRAEETGSAAGSGMGQRIVDIVRAVVGTALVTAASVGLAWIARRHVLQSPRFAVATVDVVGNERRSAAEIVAESGLVVGANVFATDLDSARAKLLTDPWVAEAALARRLPDTIVVQITERKPASLVALGDVYLATSDGEPFKKLEPNDPLDLPLVTGVSPERLAQDHEGAVRAIRRAVDLAAEYERGPLSRRFPVEEAHVEADGTFSLVVGRSALALFLGVPPFRRKLEQAARVVAELDSRPATLGGAAKAEAIMLDNDTRPERVVVRMR